MKCSHSTSLGLINDRFISYSNCENIERLILVGSTWIDLNFKIMNTFIKSTTPVL